MVEKCAQDCAKSSADKSGAGTRPDAGCGRLRLLAVAALLIGVPVAGCSSTSDSNFTFLADPGKYQFYTCEQLATDMKSLTQRQSDLKSLMDRADQSAGGTAVGLIAYKTDYINAGEEMKLLDSAARSKGCHQPETWSSSTAVR
jgi:hypothetical protein